MRNNTDLHKLKTECDKYYSVASSSENETEIAYICGWLSAMCLVYQKHDKTYFKSLQNRIMRLLKERSITNE